MARVFLVWHEYVQAQAIQVPTVAGKSVTVS